MDKVDEQTLSWIRAHPIFKGIHEGAITQILPYFRLVVSKRNEIFLQEGIEDCTNLYLILDGKLEVMKKADHESPLHVNGKTKQFSIAQLQTGDAIGELSFIKGNPRSASIKSLTNSVLLSLNPSDLTRLEYDYPAASARMMKNMIGYVGDRLKRTSENEVRALKTELQNSILKSKANLFFSYVIGLLCVYNLTLHTTSKFSRDVSQATLVSTIMVVIFSGVLYLMTRQSKLPLSNYGLTTKNWKRALKESTLWSAFIILVLIFAKWFLIENVERYQHLPLFDFHPDKEGLLFNFVLYGLHCPVQEFIARGVLQGSLQRFFSGKNVTLRAIVVSNALFSATHIHIMGGLLGIIVLVPGLFWGWLYSKHDNLLGVALSHILIGWTGLFFLNLESLF